MQAMGDGLAVLGTRHGMLWEPHQRRCYLVRFDKHPGIPFELQVGVRVGERTVILPLSAEGALFDFVEQELQPTCLVLSGIDILTALQVCLQVRIPFRPRDAEFSTVPVYYISAQVARLPQPFRWQRPVDGTVTGTLFVRIASEAFELAPTDNGLDITVQAPLTRPFGEFATSGPETLAVQERLEVLSGTPSDAGAEASFALDMGQAGPTTSLAWCAYAPPVLSVFDELCPFRYTETFASLDEVVDWAREQAEEVESYGSWFDSVVADHSLGVATTHLLGQTLHSWLVNTWWVTQPLTGEDWFSVWEGSCYFHSTVDVEFTQAPFYLTLWPELLGLELQEWPQFTKPGELCLGERGAGTLFLSHDMGVLAACGQQVYSHDMEVEEVSNYLLLAYGYWHRTGDASVQFKHAEVLRQFADFLLACDTSGNGVPDRGCSNTIDDASPAVQYGREQVYLAVKTMAALACAAELLADMGYGDTELYSRQAELIRTTVEARGWLGDHYAVALDPSAEGLRDPWSGEELHGELPGWDASHIYTANALPILDMVGRDLGLDDVRLTVDLSIACQRTLAPYGCRHTDFRETSAGTLQAGLAASGSTIGWISMNMLRDMAAAYRGVDLLAMVERYWDWQAATNAREVTLFFETFGGNNLCFYPRGVAVWGYLEAAAGLAFDRLSGESAVQALRQTTRVPLLALADWRGRYVPVFES